MEISFSDEWVFNLLCYKFLCFNFIFFFVGVFIICKVCNCKKKKIFKLKNVNMVYEDGFNYKDDKEFLFMFIIEIEWNFLWC